MSGKTAKRGERVAGDDGKVAVDAREPVKRAIPETSDGKKEANKAIER